MHFKSLSAIRDEMVGGKYKNQRGEIAIVVNVVGAGGGYQVHFNYGMPYNVVCGLGKFRKRYPHKV
ncbi:hypothetical protein [Klebsiella phage YX3973]|jgi:hypothetical protein|uniref:hypothetical protein n=1 Tax=Klebsiella phage YX3973 TaxID=2500166 RepID=UPI001017FDD6|nr:hypothetical protein KGB52_gp29 [Klebsiella phage YX3973]QAX91972.1 hypothetical protein [Klebsiella phage YX3973]